ncbi:MAG: hypothetical protein PHD20_02890 [Clostridia bacterium]|nr:hypothetical protein [Clostridia bacterium]
MKKSITITVTSEQPFKIQRGEQEKYTNIQNIHFTSKIQAITELKKRFNIELNYQHLKQGTIYNNNGYQVHVK